MCTTRCDPSTPRWVLKEIKDCDMKNAINNKANIYIKTFSGATIEDMNSYIIATE